MIILAGAESVPTEPHTYDGGLIITRLLSEAFAVDVWLVQFEKPVISTVVSSTLLMVIENCSVDMTG
jgi:hypothetical protein